MARPRFQAPVDLGSVHKIFAKCKGFEKLGSLRPSRPLYPRGNFVTLLAKILGRGYFLRFWRLLWEYQKNESFGLCKFSLLGNRKKIHPIHSHMYLYHHHRTTKVTILPVQFYFFHMCFGIIILSLFHITIQMIPIQNLSCPKIAKTYGRTCFSS